jgi:hypothetical protein
MKRTKKTNGTKAVPPSGPVADERRFGTCLLAMPRWKTKEEAGAWLQTEFRGWMYNLLTAAERGEEADADIGSDLISIIDALGEFLKTGELVGTKYTPHRLPQLATALHEWIGDDPSAELEDHQRDTASLLAANLVRAVDQALGGTASS